MSNTRRSERRASGGGQPARRRGPLLFCLLLAAYCLLPACRMDMQDQPRYEAYDAGDVKFGQRGAASRRPVEGTVARGYLREDSYLYRGVEAGSGSAAAGAQAAGAAAAGANAQAGAAQAAAGPDRFPFPVTMEVLERGKDRYEAFCAMCHGMTGNGDGMIVRRGYQRPPSYHEDRLQAGQSPASHFFDVITNGWGVMPAYAYMMPPEDRWAITAYIRALQLSRKGTLADVPPDRRAQLERGNVTPAPHGGQTGGERGDPNQGTLTPGEVRH